jgi:hypothetical protein
MSLQFPLGKPLAFPLAFRESDIAAGRQAVYHDGISLDFVADRYYTKAPGASPVAGSFESLFTFTGDNLSMYLGPSGLLIPSVTNAKRREFDANGNVRGLLIEGARTNRCLQSNDMTNVAWIKATTTTVKTATGPDGVANSATTLTATAGNATTLQAFVEAAADSTFSIWIKRRTGAGNIDITQDTGVTWTTQAVTTLWTKFACPHLSTLNPSVGIRIVTNGDAVDVWGAQFEAGAFASSTIQTTAAGVARAADVPSRVLGAEFSATAGTLYVEGRTAPSTASATGEIIVNIDDGTTNERILFYRDGPAADAMRGLIVDGGAVQMQTAHAAVTASSAFKVAIAYTLNDGVSASDVTALQTDATVTLPTVTTLRLGQRVALDHLFGHIRRLDYWPERKSNEFLRRATL